MKRRFSDLVPAAASLRKRLGQVLSGGTVATLSIAPPGVATAPRSATSAVTSYGVNIVNRSEKGKKLVLRMPDGLSYRMLLHRSHSSHASHSSHSSHYSGSTGSGSATTAPATPQSTPQVVKVDQSFQGTVETIDRQARTFTVKTANSQKYTLAYRDDTMFKNLTGTESRLDELMERTHGALPFEKGQTVKVTWKTGLSGGIIASAIAHVR